MKGSQKHYDRDQFCRYHRDVWLPRELRDQVRAALPSAGTPLRIGFHYFANDAGRTTPNALRVPHEFEIIDVTTCREDGSLYRACLRIPWDHRALCAVVEFPGPHTPHTPRTTLVTAYWNHRNDWHATLDVDVYERADEHVAPTRAVSETAAV